MFILHVAKVPNEGKICRGAGMNAITHLYLSLREALAGLEGEEFWMVRWICERIEKKEMA